ncbi:uncharacterized protein RHIMIDRAFT_274545 [Rhizopus microsporus ATCC 52813]|uniref:Zn(2)-C6 fungal-type domain-containing protein n=2 Tax=Rhizopus microsporus TaxID=58291 RepID=A0A2G4SFF6_RHIZD|nr:uncharacterized protein RHIMIDRAFT_274545 [Rhizopus microsporus ATCC 52813]PHZ07500.1 hypothetical protein RHIMIDRAFT_274545 [Rhizopus microsporus ATCC 52813]
MSASVVKQSVASKDIQPRQKRFKVGKACFTCREKKIKCDGVQPCMQCKARKRPCTFSKDGMLDNSDHIADEGEKSDHVKKKIKTKNSSSNHSSHSNDSNLSHGNSRSSNASTSTSSSSSSNSSASRRKGSNDDNNNSIDNPTEKQKTVDILDKLANLLPGEGKEGKWEIDDGHLKLRGHHFYYNNPAETNDDIIEMPDRTVQKELINLYFNHGYSVFPILPRKLFLKQFEMETDQELMQPLLLFVLFAFGAQYKGKNSTETADIYFKQAKQLLDKALNYPRPSTIIALALMSLYDGNFFDSRKKIYSSIAFQMCFDLNLMKDYSGDYIIEEENNIEILELRKRICWGCYYLDKIIHIQSGQPWMIRSKDIELDMPLLQPGDDITEHEILEVFVSSMKLMQIGERLIQNDQHIIIDNIHNELLHYLRSLPPHLQWTTTQSIIPPIPPPHSPRNSMVCQLHILYNLIELIILKPYSTSYKQRIITVSTNLIRLITLLTEKPKWILNYHFILSTLIESIKILLKYSACEVLTIARHSRYMFQQSIQLLQLFLYARNSLYATINEFATKLDALLLSTNANNLNQHPLQQQQQQHQHQQQQSQQDIYDLLNPFILHDNNTPWSIDFSTIKTKSYTTPSVTAPSFTPHHDHLFHTSWRAAMTIPDRIHYPFAKLHLDFKPTATTPTPTPTTTTTTPNSNNTSSSNTNTNNNYAQHHDLSTDQLAALVAQIQESSEKDNGSSASNTSTPNNDDLLFTLLSDTRQKDHHPHRQSFSHPYMNVGLGIYASAHQHHNDVIRQHMPDSSTRPVLLSHQGQAIVTNTNDNKNKC